jgi:AraC family transcriptional regulator
MMMMQVPLVAPDDPLCRPYTASHFHVERSVAANGIFADIRHFGWDDVCHADFEARSYYLDYSLGPRTGTSRLLPHGRASAPPGDIVFLPKGASYQAHCEPGEHSLLCVTFASDRARDLFENENLSGDLSPCFDVRNARVRQALARLVEEVRDPGFAQDILVESLAITLVVDLCRHLRDLQQPSPVNGRMAPWRMRRLKDRIVAELGAQLSVAELAAECGMSQRHLIRTFKATEGITLTDYIAAIRIGHAKRALQGEDTMIKVIAGQCGFHSAAAFSAAFRKATGQTPKAYRQERLMRAS